MALIHPDGLRPLGRFAFSESFRCSGEGAGWVAGLARLFVSCQELQLFPLDTALWLSTAKNHLVL